MVQGKYMTWIKQEVAVSSFTVTLERPREFCYEISLRLSQSVS